MNTLYSRYAFDVTESVFNSIYDDLYAMAEKDQKLKWKSVCEKSKSEKLRKMHYTIGDSQLMLNGWCNNKMSLGMVLDFIKMYKDFI